MACPLYLSDWATDCATDLVSGSRFSPIYGVPYGVPDGVYRLFSRTEGSIIVLSMFV